MMVKSNRRNVTVKLYNNTTDAFIGDISEAQLQFLIDQLEEELLEDKDYAITPMTLGYFQERGVDPELLSLLQKALEEEEELVIRWSRS